MKKILIADDHEIVRRGVSMMIQSFPEAYEIMEVSSCARLLEVITSVKLDFAILDMTLLDGNITSIIDQVIDHCKETSVIVYSMNAEHIYAPRFLSKGFKGFVSKQASIHELEKAIKAVLQGDTYLSPTLQDMLINVGRQNQGRSPIDTLSDRELEVSEYLTIGMGIKEIAQKTNLDITTVSTYKRRAFEKLGVQNSVELKEKMALYRQ